jgi:hypothetical protein
MASRAPNCERRTARAISQTDAGYHHACEANFGGVEAPPVALVRNTEDFIVLREGGLREGGLREGGLLLVISGRRELLRLAES